MHYFSYLICRRFVYYYCRWCMMAFTCSTAFNHTQVLCYYFNLLEMYTDSFKVMESVCV